MQNRVKNELIDRLKDRSAMIGIFGLGYVGLPLALRYCEAGFRVVGFDIDERKVDKLAAGRSDIARIAHSKIAGARDAGFEPTADFSKAAAVDALILCVPTPLGRHREPDLRFVTGTVETIVPYLRKGQVLSLESTTYPGTTEEELLPRRGTPAPRRIDGADGRRRYLSGLFART